MNSHSRLSFTQADLLEFDHLVFGSHRQQLCWCVRPIKPVQLAFGCTIIKIVLSLVLDLLFVSSLIVFTGISSLPERDYVLDLCYRQSVCHRLSSV